MSGGGGDEMLRAAAMGRSRFSSGHSEGKGCACATLAARMFLVVLA